MVQADGTVRSFSCGEGIGVEFTNLAPRDRVLLGQLLRRLLRLLALPEHIAIHGTRIWWRDQKREFCQSQAVHDLSLQVLPGRCYISGCRRQNI